MNLNINCITLYPRKDNKSPHMENDYETRKLVRATIVDIQHRKQRILDYEKTYTLKDMSKDSGIPKSSLYKCANMTQTMSLPNYLKLKQLAEKTKEEYYIKQNNVYNSNNNKKH